MPDFRTDLINTTHPAAIRTIMIIPGGPRGEAYLARYHNSEMVEAFGADVVARINRGELAIYHPPRNGLRIGSNYVAFDVVLHAIAHNADLFESVKHILR